MNHLHPSLLLRPLCESYIVLFLSMLLKVGTELYLKAELWLYATIIRSASSLVPPLLQLSHLQLRHQSWLPRQKRQFHRHLIIPTPIQVTDRNIVAGMGHSLRVKRAVITLAMRTLRNLKRGRVPTMQTSSNTMQRARTRIHHGTTISNTPMARRRSLQTPPEQVLGMLLLRQRQLHQCRPTMQASSLPARSSRNLSEPSRTPSCPPPPLDPILLVRGVTMRQLVMPLLLFPPISVRLLMVRPRR